MQKRDVKSFVYHSKEIDKKYTLITKFGGGFDGW